jgi:hypothetical protein
MGTVVSRRIRHVFGTIKPQRTSNEINSRSIMVCLVGRRTAPSDPSAQSPLPRLNLAITTCQVWPGHGPVAGDRGRESA